ncbi:biotin transporter BioY [Nocardioides sp. AE5]|uniref:biotin transporter BioY n=1 Tax=Nocardioides sp. AE5 TaxID=2962573 RepID=UPI002882923E|nr:biotin transporter BioY [Nocardioides sp. AE5]MDT0202874.1 biotin transporter BioY [Nocardioides sp. AE5]
MTTSRRTSTPTDIALISGFAALIAVAAILPAINLAGPVPITLQTFAVLLAGACLGATRGFLAVVLYIAVGAAGLPIFSNGAAGLGVLAGPTAGYLIGFPFAAALCGFLVQRLPRQKIQQSVPLVFAAGLLSSAVFIHTAGMAGLVLRADMTWAQAFDVDKVFWIGDVLKNIAMAFVATAVHRAFPDLLDRGTTTSGTTAVDTGASTSA